MGYFVCCIQRLSELESSDTLTGADENSTEVVPDFEKYILELQPAERGMQSKIVEADLVLWTVGTKPPLPQLEPSDVPFAIPLNARGQHHIYFLIVFLYLAGCISASRLHWLEFVGCNQWASTFTI